MAPSTALAVLVHLAATAAQPPGPAPSPRFRQAMAGHPHLALGAARTRAPAPAATTLRLTDFGGDPTGLKDSAAAFDAALAAAWARAGGASPHNFTDGPDLGGVVVDLEGGQYGLSRPVVMPQGGGGNVNIIDGSVRALPAFGPIHNQDPQQYLFRFDGSPDVDWTCQDVTASAAAGCKWYTYIRFENLVLDAQLRGGCIKIAYSTRITVAETFLTGFSSVGLWAAQPNEDVVLIDSFLGTFDWRSQHCLDSHQIRSVAVQLDGPDNLISNTIMFCSGLGISSAGVNMINQVHIFTGTSYALDRVADPPVGALWVRGMEYIGNGTGALNGGHKVHTVRITESYFDYAPVWLDDPMEVAFDMCYFLGNPGVSTATGAALSLWPGRLMTLISDELAGCPDPAVCLAGLAAAAGPAAADPLRGGQRGALLPSRLLLAAPRGDRPLGLPRLPRRFHHARRDEIRSLALEWGALWPVRQELFLRLGESPRYCWHLGCIRPSISLLTGAALVHQQFDRTFGLCYQRDASLVRPAPDRQHGRARQHVHRRQGSRHSPVQVAPA